MAYTVSRASRMVPLVSEAGRGARSSNPTSPGLGRQPGPGTIPRRATLTAVKRRRRPSAQEALAYEIVRGAVEDLLKVEAALKAVQRASPDAERDTHLRAIAGAIRKLIGATPGSPD
jgi:hypothetical protein